MGGAVYCCELGGVLWVCGLGEGMWLWRLKTSLVGFFVDVVDVCKCAQVGPLLLGIKEGGVGFVALDGEECLGCNGRLTLCYNLLFICHFVYCL